MSTTAATAHSFNKILNQPKYPSKARISGDVDESVKKLRRLILVDGIPSAEVSSYCNSQHYNISYWHLSRRTHPCGHGYGRYFSELQIYPQKSFCDMLHEDHVRFGRRSEMIRSGLYAKCFPWLFALTAYSEGRWLQIVDLKSESMKTCSFVCWTLLFGVIMVRLFMTPPLTCSSKLLLR